MAVVVQAVPSAPHQAKRTAKPTAPGTALRDGVRSQLPRLPGRPPLGGEGHQRAGMDVVVTRRLFHVGASGAHAPVRFG